MDDHIYKKAKTSVKKKKGFYIHFGVYIAVGIFFLLMNILTFNESGEWWFFFPMLPWGVGLMIHYLSIFGLPGTKILTREWEEEELDKEIERLKRIRSEEAARERLLRSGTDFDDALDLKELDKQKEELFDEEDLV